MKGIKRLFYALFVVLLVFSSCKNNIQDNNNENKNNEKTAYIKIGGSLARSILPSFNLDSMTDFVLLGIEEGSENEKILAETNSYSELSGKTIAIAAGNWTFTLTSKEEDTTFSDTIVESLDPSEICNLEFLLKVDLNKTSSENGAINLTLSFSQDSGIKGVKAGLYAVDTEKSVSGFSEEELELQNGTSVCYLKTKVPTGEYWFKADFYADSECSIYLNSYESVIEVIAGKSTASGIDIEKLNKVHTITYELNGGSFVDGYVPQTTYARLSKTNLPSEKDIIQDGYAFGGWYLEEDFSGSRVKTTAVFSGDVVLYAKWQYGIYVTPENIDNIDLSTEFGELVIIATGDFNNKFTALCNVIKEYDDTIILDMSGVTNVRKIPNEAFKGCYSLKSVILPETVIQIGDYAFSYCTRLTDITISDKCTNIGKYAFENCYNLHNFEVPAGITSIENYAFSGCSGLTSITIPKRVPSMSYSTFDKCSNLKTVYYNGTLEDWLNISFSFGSNPCRNGADLYIQGEKITQISATDIPESVTSIGAYLFDGCTSLQSVELPESITSIGASAFSGCTSLQSVDIPESITSIGNAAFSGCTSLVINLKSLADSPLMKYIKSQYGEYKIKLGEEITEINEKCFYESKGLISIEIPASITAFGANAFYNCTNLKTVYYNGTLENWLNISCDSYYSNPCCKGADLYIQGEKLTQISETDIPESITSIGAYAFDGCASLQSVEFTNSVTSFGERAFSSCSNLKTVYYNGTLEDWLNISFDGYGSNPCSNGADLYLYLYGERTKLTSIYREYLPTGSISSIGAYAFEGCVSLTSVEFWAEEINESAFNNCSSLESVRLYGVKKIGSNAFYHCYKIKSINFPDSLTEIGQNAFRGCNIKDVTGRYYSWYRCYNDTSVYGESLCQALNYGDALYRK